MRQAALTNGDHVINRIGFTVHNSKLLRAALELVGVLLSENEAEDWYGRLTTNFHYFVDKVVEHSKSPRNTQTLRCPNPMYRLWCGFNENDVAKGVYEVTLVDCAGKFVTVTEKGARITMGWDLASMRQDDVLAWLRNLDKLRSCLQMDVGTVDGCNVHGDWQLATVETHRRAATLIRDAYGLEMFDDTSHSAVLELGGMIWRANELRQKVASKIYYMGVSEGEHDVEED